MDVVDLSTKGAFSPLFLFIIACPLLSAVQIGSGPVYRLSGLDPGLFISGSESNLP